jgi:cyclopropane fatty-acyl-phospholipid synthase-like methyltransferase
MNRTHEGVTAWGLGHVAINADVQVLDIGCGGGRTIGILAAKAKMVHGLDHSASSVAASRRVNAI